MAPKLPLSRQTGVILAEVGFLLILFAGVLLIIATRWGQFGQLPQDTESHPAHQS